MEQRKSKHWKNEDNIIEELNTIIQQLGKFPTYAQMPSYLRTAIKRSEKNINYYQKKMNCPEGEKPKGYWKNIENLKKEINKIIKKNFGVFPTLSIIENELGSGGKKAVLSNGGIYQIAQVMGHPYHDRALPQGIIQTPDGHYVLSGYEFLFDEFLHSRNIPHEVNGFIQKNKKYRYDFKIGDIYVEIWGYEQNRKQKRCIKYNKRRKIKENIYKDHKLKLLSIECSQLKRPIKEVFTYFIEICKKYNWNTEEIKKPDLNKYFTICKKWTDDKIKYELSKITKELNKFPTSGDLKKLKLGGLLDAISRNGGIIKYANLLGHPKPYKRRKYWNENKVIEEIEQVLKTHSKFPTSEMLIKNKMGYLSQQISKYGGFRYFKSFFKT